VGVGVGEGVACATGVATIQSEKLSADANARADAMTGTLRERSPHLLGENNFFMRCSCPTIVGRTGLFEYVAFYISFSPSGQRESNPHGQLGRLELYH
jgi:hypothetical protein